MAYDPPAGTAPRVPDQRLTRSFQLHEFPGWWMATPQQVARLRAQLSRFWQPLRNHVGAIVPTSWMWSKTSGRPRTGAHADPGTVDAVPLSAVAQFQMADEKSPLGQTDAASAHRRRGRELISAAHAWAARSLPGTFGELIDERDHIHATAPGVGGNGQVLHEPREGSYAAGPFAVPLVGGGLLLAAYLLYLVTEG